MHIKPPACLLAACLSLGAGNADAINFSASPTEAASIAREAYLYGFPVVEMYKTLYTQAVDTQGKTSRRRSMKSAIPPWYLPPGIPHS